MTKTALLSVSDKTGIVAFAQGLQKRGYRLVASGGTRRVLLDHGVAAMEVAALTGFAEMLDGRVKTLHPAVHAALLARRDDPAHMAALKAQGIAPIDLVAVNLYPFDETVQDPAVSLAAASEQIDIGGPSMLRSAAKNFAAVAAVVDPEDYPKVLVALDAETLDEAFRRHLAVKVFQQTSAYDALIAQYLAGADPEADEFPDTLTLTYRKHQDLRYGENSHQHAAFYAARLPVPFSLTSAKQLNGKALSYNNIKDADAALRIAKEFTDPAVIAVKHMNPCGIGLGATIEQAWQRAYAADATSIFGGIIVLNRPVDRQTAQKMHPLFLEMIIAPSFTPEALALLAEKKNRRLLALDFTASAASKKETVSVLGGLLQQEPDVLVETAADFEVVTTAQPTAAQIEALVFAQTVVKHVKSNAIVVATADQTLGIGAGQLNRIGAVKLAVEQASASPRYQEAVLASDAFFPLADCVAYAAAHGIKAIVQPGGSIKDQASIDKANEWGITMVFTNRRHFRH